MLKKRCLVIIPAFNEEQNIKAVIQHVKAQPFPKDVLVVDDCSSDQTATVAKKVGAKVVSLICNLGYGAAVETGYKYAMENNYGIVVQLDGDGQHEPRCISDLIHALHHQRADVVIGSRFLGKNSCYRPTLLRKIGMRFFQWVIRLCIHETITDPTSGYQALDKRVVRFFVENNLYPTDYPDADIILLLHNVGFKIVEVPVVMYQSTTGKSMHSGFKPLYYMIKMLLSIFSVQFGAYRTFLRREKPCR
jgi:glycosyltransferase involved in cell wall biosynthesis